MQTQTHTSTTKIVISFYHCSFSSCLRTDPRRMHRAAVLQRCRPRRGALESQARAQEREGSVQNTRGRPRRGGSGGRQRGEAGLERGRRRAQGVFQATAKLTDNGTGGEERRRGGATTNGGGGRRAAPTALQGGLGGLMRREITETNRVVERTT